MWSQGTSRGKNSRGSPGTMRAGQGDLDTGVGSALSCAPASQSCAVWPGVGEGRGPHQGGKDQGQLGECLPHSLTGNRDRRLPTPHPTPRKHLRHRHQAESPWEAREKAQTRSSSSQDGRGATIPRERPPPAKAPPQGHLPGVGGVPILSQEPAPPLFFLGLRGRGEGGAPTRCPGHRANRGPCPRPAAGATRACRRGSGRR